jgi:nitric oxide reductase NorE protein
LAGSKKKSNQLPENRRNQSKLPGDPGVWVFIGADMCAFLALFVLFECGRVGKPALYERSRVLLNPRLGILNTLILLASSLFMARAVSAAREGDRAGVRRNLRFALLIGAGFGVSKVVEYKEKIGSGITMLTNEFFSYYFVLTGIHFLHFLVGIVVLSVCASKARRDPIDQRFLLWIESGGCYWHMVDLLWVVLFPMLYLQRSGV